MQIWSGVSVALVLVCSALTNAQSEGQLADDADLDELAAFFTMALIGVAASIRAEASPQQLRAAASVATSVLDAHRPAAVT